MSVFTEILNVLEAADFLRVKPATIYAWVHQRKLPFRKHGRKLAFLRKDLASWSDGKRVLPLDEFCAMTEDASSSLTTRRTSDGGPSL